MASPSKTRKLPPPRNVVGLVVRRCREAKGWSQSDLARQLQLAGWDIERTVLTKIELRRRCVTDYELMLLAKTLEVPLSEFMVSARELAALFEE